MPEMRLTADCPAEALHLATKHCGEIHLLVTDVVMPGQNGRDLATQLALDRPGMKRHSPLEAAGVSG